MLSAAGLEAPWPARETLAIWSDLTSTDAPAAPSGETLVATGEAASNAFTGLSTPLERFTSADELADYLLQDALERYRGLFGQPAGWPVLPPGLDREGATVFDVLNGVVPAASDPDHSDTNTQVAGVDEADLVETDGNYLYVLSDQELVILDSWPPEELQVVSRAGIDGWPLGEYLYGDRLAVLSLVDRFFWPLDPVDVPVFRAALPVPCLPPRVKVTVFDVTDRQAPEVVQETELDGWLVDSRAIDGFVLLVVRDDFGLPGPIPVRVAPSDGQPPVEPNPDAGVIDSSRPDIWLPWPPGDQQYVYETQEEYLARVAGHELELGLPQFAGRGADGELASSGLLVQPTDIYRPVSSEDRSLVSIVVFDMSSDAPGPVSSVGVPFPYVSEVYASRESLYLLNPGWWVDGQTSILKFAFDATSGSVTLSATGSVPGRVLDQFSVDEYNGYLRIATTQDWGTSARNNLYVLQQAGEDLAIVGRLEDLAPGEQIYSARFLADRAFLVTFRVIDPLFAIDLGDPTRPQVRGELEIPGFSNYLHPVGEDFLIGIGRESDESTGRLGPPQVSLFDVSDLGSPTLLDRFTIDVGPWGWSEAFGEHHAVSYFPESQVLAFPISSSGEWVVDDTGAEVYLGPRTDLWVFHIDVDGGTPLVPSEGAIELLGRVEHDLPVRRSMRIEDFLYVVSADTVSAHRLLDPATELARVHFRIQYLAPVDFEEIVGRDLRTSDLWYSFTTTHQGLLTLEATLLSRTDGLRLTLCDEQLKPLASSVSDAAALRIDWLTDADTTYYLQVSPVSQGMPTGSLFDLRLGNLVSQRGDRLTVYGTEDDDRFEFSAGRSRRLAVNRLSYDVGAEVRSITWDGAGGGDVLVIRGSDARETLKLWPGQGTFSAEGYAVNIAGVEMATIYSGGGGDAAFLYDNPNGIDKLKLWPDRVRFCGEGFEASLVSFASVYAYATEGNGDVAALWDDPTGKDTLKAWPDQVRFSGSGFQTRLFSFDFTYACATEGSGDVALLFDDPGAKDVFKAWPDQARLYGAGFQNRAYSFDNVYAYSTEGSGDVALLFDDPAAKDVLKAWPDQVRFSGEGFQNRAYSFDRVSAYASAGGDDVALLYDDPLAADTFEAWPTYARLFGSGFDNRVQGFRWVSATATPGGTDVAWLHGSGANDTFRATPGYSRLRGTGFDNRALSFAQVHAFGAGGRSNVATLLDALLESGTTLPPASTAGIVWLYEFDKIYQAESDGDQTVIDALDAAFTAYWP